MEGFSYHPSLVTVKWSKTEIDTGERARHRDRSPIPMQLEAWLLITGEKGRPSTGKKGWGA